MSTYSDASGAIMPLPKARRATGFGGVVPALA
ncbi:ABC transporter permease, partial [Rhizobium phaseoli]